MKSVKFYESEKTQKVMGETLRPGGLETTKRALEFCNFSQEAKILDLGCGKGRTIKFLEENYDLALWGIDKSEKLACQAQQSCKNTKIITGSGESMIFEDDFFDGVFAECTLSLMDNLEYTISEVKRIMKKKGFFIISDLSAKNTGHLGEMKGFNLDSCLKNPHDIKELKDLLCDKGFKVLLLENHDNFLVQLIADIIFEHNTLEEFWTCDKNSSIDGKKFQDLLKKLKLGYFLMIAQKI